MAKSDPWLNGLADNQSFVLVFIFSLLYYFYEKPVKKILFTIILILLTPSFAVAQDDEIFLEFDEKFQRLVINDNNHSIAPKIEINEYLPVDNQPADILENSNSLTPETKLFNGISQTVQNLYKLEIDNTDKPTSLFKDQLTKNFENGSLESLYIWGVIQSNMDIEIPENGGGYSKFNPSLVNVLFDGKIKGGHENFRLMLDPSHQHNRPFFQQFVQDAYIKTDRIPHHTILFGNSRTGTGYEGAQSPYTLPFINRSQISRNLANIRKVGLRVKGDYTFVDYDFGGYSSSTFFSEFMPGVEFDGWINLKPLAKTNDKHGKLTTGGGIVKGTKNSTDYFVSGAYVGYEYKKFWTRMEYAVSNGSNGGSGLTTKHRQGWYVTLGYHLTKKLELLARYDEFDPDKKISNNNQREYTAGVNYYIKGQALKLILNYIFCQNDAKRDSHRLLIGAQLAI